MNSVRLYLVVFGLGVFSSSAQMVAPIQNYNCPALTNPSLVGLNSGTKVSMIHRSSWASAIKGYTNNLFGFESFIKDQQNSVGLAGYVMDEGLGNSLAIAQRFNRTAVGIVGAYHVLLGKGDKDDLDRVRSHYFSGGATFYYANYRSNWSNLVFSDQLNPVFGMSPSSPTQSLLPIGTTYQAASIDIGANYIMKNLLAKGLGLLSDYHEFGASYSNISAVRGAFYYSDILAQRQLKVHSRSEFGLKNDRSTHLSLLGYYETNGTIWTTSFLVSSTNKTMRLGLGLQHSRFGVDAYQAALRLNAVIGFWIPQEKYGNGFHLAYAFSSSLGNSRTNYLGNNHELTLGYNFMNSDRKNESEISVRGTDIL